MTMDELWMLPLASMAGVLLGGVFFGGLWWTVRKAISSRRPALWFLGSLVVRTVIVLAGFHYVSGAHWERLLASLLGFLAARVVVTRLTPPPVKHRNASSREVGHAT
jgi:F1F0 ATPase subunit 2